jgi:hypothetical protein
MIGGGIMQLVMYGTQNVYLVGPDTVFDRIYTATILKQKNERYNSSLFNEKFFIKNYLLIY